MLKIIKNYTRFMTFMVVKIIIIILIEKIILKLLLLKHFKTHFFFETNAS